MNRTSGAAWTMFGLDDARARLDGGPRARSSPVGFNLRRESPSQSKAVFIPPGSNQ
jgi:hypothetical protein